MDMRRMHVPKLFELWESHVKKVEAKQKKTWLCNQCRAGEKNELKAAHVNIELDEVHR